MRLRQRDFCNDSRSTVVGIPEIANLGSRTLCELTRSRKSHCALEPLALVNGLPERPAEELATRLASELARRIAKRLARRIASTLANRLVKELAGRIAKQIASICFCVSFLGFELVFC